jgi:hypothetical protein
MKKVLWSMLILVFTLTPTLAFAKGVPLFFQTGDELFAIEGAPTFDGGYSVGYACQRFGLFGADIWTWDCQIMAINIEEFAAGDLEPDFKVEMESKYSESDRVRDPWNHYGGAIIAALLVGGIAVKVKKKG